jgi:hypothetical protein
MSEASTMAAPAARAAADAVLVALRGRLGLAIVFARHRDPVQGDVRFAGPVPGEPPGGSR